MGPRYWGLDQIFWPQFFYKSFFLERKCEKVVRLYNMRWEELTIILY